MEYTFVFAAWSDRTGERQGYLMADGRQLIADFHVH
jgi:hypothetical protein